MGLLQKLSKQLPSSSSPVLSRYNVWKMISNDSSCRAYFRRRIRLSKNSYISIPLGFILLFPCIVLLLIVVLFIRHTGLHGPLMPAGSPPSIRRISDKYDKIFVTGCQTPKVDAPRAKGVFVILARNKELAGVLESLKSVERHFNRWFHYPYVFLNDGDFDSDFKEAVKNHTSAPIEFGRINETMWGYPEWIDSAVAQELIRKQGDAAIMYGGMESYHHMCRYYSGFFYKHELLAKYDWYWRVEPEIKYFCDITYDPFIEMERANKTYGFTIAVKELRETVPNLFRYASAYKRINNLTSAGLWEMFLEKPETESDALEDNVSPAEVEPGSLPPIELEAMEGESYNMCHFWSNFEIARLDWFRSKEYNDFFEMMDRSGGFWAERWGDAPIHSLAAGALLGPKDIHYFRDFGYRHTTIQHCPANAPARQLPREPYLEGTTLDEKERIEEDEYWESYDPEKENGMGCRCRCDVGIEDVEGKMGSCLPEWVEVAGGWSSP